MGGQFSARTIPYFMVRIFLMEISADYNDGSESASLRNPASSGEEKMDGEALIKSSSLILTGQLSGKYHETTNFQDVTT